MKEAYLFPQYKGDAEKAGMFKMGTVLRGGQDQLDKEQWAPAENRPLWANSEAVCLASGSHLWHHFFVINIAHLEAHQCQTFLPGSSLKTFGNILPKS
jgi:hypothetical protein